MSSPYRILQVCFVLVLFTDIVAADDPVYQVSVPCNETEHDALCPAFSSCQSINGVYECCNGDTCSDPVCPENASNQCHALAYCSAASGAPVCSCPEGLYGNGVGEVADESDAGCKTTAWTIRISVNLLSVVLEDVNVAGQLTSWGEQQMALARVLFGSAHDDARNDAGIPVHFLTSMHHTVVQVAPGQFQLTVNSLFRTQPEAVAARANMEALLVAGRMELFGEVVNEPINGSWSVKEPVLVWGPREYTWVAQTSANLMSILPTGLTVERVFFKSDCEASGCWVVDVTYTTGANNFNVMYIPNAVGDDSLSIDFDYTAVPATAPWTTWNKDPASTFFPANFPCGSNDYVPGSGMGNNPPVKVTACCISEFTDLYRPVASFDSGVPVMKASCDGGNVPIYAKPEETTPQGQAAMPDSALEGPFAGMSHSSVVNTGIIDPFVGIYQARLYLDEVELRQKAGILTGTVGVEHAIDTFVGISNFKPTGTAFLDAAAYQVAIHLEKTSFFSVSTHGTNDYTFLEYVNVRLVSIYLEDTDFSETTDEFADRSYRTNATAAAHYVQITFTLNAKYQPNTNTGIVPLDSVRVGHGAFFSESSVQQHACAQWDASFTASTFPERALFVTRLAQSCAPAASMCNNPAAISDQFVSFNVPLGIEWLPPSSQDLSANVFVDMVVSVLDTTASGVPNQGGEAGQMKTTLSASIPVVEGGVNIFCDGVVAKTDLADVANADIILGSAKTDAELDRLTILVDIASSNLGPTPSQRIDTDSIEAGLMTLVVKGDASYFHGNAGTAGYSLELEDVITVHIMEESDTKFSAVNRLLSQPPDDNDNTPDGYHLNGAFRFSISREQQRAHLEPTAELLDECPFNPPRPAPGNAPLETCVIRRDVRFRSFPHRVGAWSTAIEIAPRLQYAAEEEARFMQTVLGASDYAQQLARDYSAVLDARYTLNGRYSRAWWINPGYEWTPTQTGGESVFTLSQKLLMFALINLNENYQDPSSSSASCDDFAISIQGAGKCFFSPGGFWGWEDARQECQAYGGDLATVSSQEEDELVQSLMDEHAMGNAWIGGNDLVEEGSFVWLDGTSLARDAGVYENFSPGEPNDSGGREDCVHIWTGVTNRRPPLRSWNDYNCANSLEFLCETTAASQPGGEGAASAEGEREKVALPPLATRRMLLSQSSQAAGAGAGVGAASVVSSVSPTSMMASAFGVPEARVATWRVTLEVSEEDACLQLPALQGAVRARVEEMVAMHASPLETVQVLSLLLDRQGITCAADPPPARRSQRLLLAAPATTPSVEAEVLLVFSAGFDATLDIAALQKLPAILDIEPLAVSPAVAAGTPATTEKEEGEEKKKHSEASAPTPSSSSSSSDFLIVGVCGGVGALLVLVGAAFLYQRYQRVQQREVVEALQIKLQIVPAEALKAQLHAEV